MDITRITKYYKCYNILHNITWCYMIQFDFKEMKWKGISVDDVMRWESRFPDVDVVKEIKVEMTNWLECKQRTKQAHKKNWESFILKWLRRKQERSIGQ